MPLYDFKCPECGCREEIQIKYEQRDAVYHCDKCDSILERQLSAPVVRRGAGIHGQDASSKDWGEFK